MASVWTLRLLAPPFQDPLSTHAFVLRKDSSAIATYTRPTRASASSQGVYHNLMVRALVDSNSTSAPATPTQGRLLPSSSLQLKPSLPFSKLQDTIHSLPPLLFYIKRHSGPSFSIGLIAAATIFSLILKSYLAKKSKYSQPGSVADLVRRGQLRSDRRGISAPLKYEDPFNNPLVKAGKSNSTVEMCGKVYRLAPVTLTKEQQAVHQKRRSRAYQWKRPKVFLREGDSVPSDVDPDTVRWIPANHPFATTASDIDEDVAQNNVYQKDGVPFRIRAEHEALQRKLEALQKGQKLGKLVLDPGAAKDFERPFKLPLNPEDQIEHNVPNSLTQKKESLIAEPNHGSVVNRASPDEME